MDRQLFVRLIAFLLFLTSSVSAFSTEENFVLINGVTNKTVLELGPNINEPLSPCSTFKIVLSLMGYDSEILQDIKTPVWEYKEGYDDLFETWKAPQSPQSWMKHSCIWYSKVLALHLGLEKIQKYLTSFEYGNLDMSGGITTAWVKSSLKISAKGQVDFLQKMINKQLLVSSKSIQMTKSILFVDQLPNGWNLFGKTGWSGKMDNDLMLGWFVGWVEKEDHFFPFAYNICDSTITLSQRIPRVKQLLFESNIFD